MLETQRLLIRELTEDDIDRFQEYRDKKEVALYQSWDRYSKWKAQRRIKYCLKHPLTNKNGSYQLGIERKEDHELIGDLFIQIDNEMSFSLGYTLDSPYWSHGYASEAVRRIILYMNEQYDYEYVYCHVYQDNERSIRLLENNGFKKISANQYYNDFYYKKKIKEEITE